VGRHKADVWGNKFDILHMKDRLFETSIMQLGLLLDFLASSCSPARIYEFSSVTSILLNTKW
jgi:hypothetical protein